MALRRLEILDDAAAEIEAATEWYFQRSVTAAAGFVGEIGQAFQSIQRSPERCPSRSHGARRFLLRRFPYSIIYRLFEDRIEIVAVMHARRRPNYWRDRT